MIRSRICFFLVPFALAMLGCGGTSRTAINAVDNVPDVVAVIDGQPVTLQEFEERYARTVGGLSVATNDSVEQYEDFLDRYVNFRLKVKAGMDAGLNTDAGIRKEIESYRSTLARPYLIDREVLDPLIREMHERQQHFLDASHILLRVDPAAAPEDTIAIFRGLVAIADSIRDGADFGDMAVAYSEDPSAQRDGLGGRGRLGYFSAGRMVREFEDAAYGAEVGELVGPIRTQFGYHLIRVEGRRAAIPDIEVAHLMITPASPTPADSSAALEKIREIARELAEGADFAALASEHSVDRQSAPRGGEIGAISYTNQRIPEDFREAAFALSNEGDVSDVVETPFGYHLIKLTSRGELPSIEEAYESLKTMASRLPQARQGEIALAQRIWASYGGSLDTTLILDRLGDLSGDSLVTISMTPEALQAYEDDVAATLADSAYTLASFVGYAGQRGIQRADDVRSRLVDLMTDYVTEKAIEYETAALEFKDDEFGRIMAEFREGLVLFKLMEDSVWTRAATDSLALESYFNARRDAYQFPERTRILAFHSSSDSTVRALGEYLEARNQAAVDGLLAEEGAISRVDTVRIAETSNSVYDQVLATEVGTVIGPIRQNREWVVLLHDGMEEPRPKTFEEARASVVSEYQDVLEEELVNRLRRQFAVQVYPERLILAFDDSTTEGREQTSSAE